MTGANDAWGDPNSDNAMDSACGAGSWTKVQGFTASVFSGSSFIYMDGGNSDATEFGNFLIANTGLFSSFLSSGGHALVHVAPNQDGFSRYALPEVLTLDVFENFNYPTASFNVSLTAAGLTAGLDANGAGTAWTGNAFTQCAVFGGTCLIIGENGCALANSGNLWAGGEASPVCHSGVSGSDSFQLLVNELLLPANGASVLGGAVPEPASWAMLMAGFGLVGATMRRRRTAALAPTA